MTGKFRTNVTSWHTELNVVCTFVGVQALET